MLKIIEKLLQDISGYEQKLNVTTGQRVEYRNFSVAEMKVYSEQLRLYRRDLQEKEDHQNSQSVGKIEEYIHALENIYEAEEKPIALEKYVSLGLNALNNALKIKPNYPVGDDNEPTFTAPANVPDVECYYKSDNAICEVTMLTGRDQWYNEGQPVMRHLRDFEDKNKDKKSYCVFIAPKLHRDTVNTFWMAIKYEYEGKAQKIIPLSVQQFIDLLKALVDFKKKGRFLKHEELFQFYDEVIKIFG